MPRLQVYLPDDLYRAVKDRGLPASDLLRRAVQAELRRQTLLEETARYVDELVAEVGIPDDAAMAKAEAVADQVRRPRDASRAS
jgi:post-segregation antitoxin (ccd killing protein)